MAISVEYIELRTEMRRSLNSSASYAISPMSERSDATLVDLTNNGAGLLLDQPVSPGRFLDLTVDNAQHRARVRWIVRHQQGFRVGVSFEAA
ncbi:MAG: PilZ domain-containing protein [Chromatiales bacterium]|jgi:hypothetical protein|nr:PilZ domain-containing protein [Chromatiales bacterium]